MLWQKEYRPAGLVMLQDVKVKTRKLSLQADAQPSNILICHRTWSVSQSCEGTATAAATGPGGLRGPRGIRRRDGQPRLRLRRAAAGAAGLRAEGTLLRPELLPQHCPGTDGSFCQVYWIPNRIFINFELD